MGLHRFLAVLICLLMPCCVTSGAELDPQLIQASISQSADRFETAFKSRDAKVIAALFTSEAEYIDSTEVVFHGREAIEAEFAAAFEVRPAGTLEIEFFSIRPIADGVVVEDGVSRFQPDDESFPSSQMRYTVTHVRQPDGSWLMASVRELSESILTPHDRLKELSWLLGNWREDSDGSVVTTEWKWTKDGNFFIAEFSIRSGNEDDLQGTHRIGWDAERKQFRSWVFESTGGSADGWWTEGENGSWTVSLTGVDSDGDRLESLMTYSADGLNAIVIVQDHRVRGGISLPGRSARLVRQPPAPGVKPVP